MVFFHLAHEQSETLLCRSSITPEGVFVLRDQDGGRLEANQMNASTGSCEGVLESGRPGASLIAIDDNAVRNRTTYPH